MHLWDRPYYTGNPDMNVPEIVMNGWIHCHPAFSDRVHVGIGVGSMEEVDEEIEMDWEWNCWQEMEGVMIVMD